MIRSVAILGLLCSPIAVSAQQTDKKEDACAYESQVMGAVQQARLDRVKQEDVASHIAGTNPTWPEKYSNAIPDLANFVYAQKRRDLRNMDLASLWEEQCLATWEQRQEMIKNLKN